jgi:cyclic pyranopterin monophosphate synthase
MISDKLTHLDADGRPTMVDVSDKVATARSATAQGVVSMSKQAFSLALGGQNKKGDVRMIAQIAGIMGAKKTAELIPLCHPLPLTSIKLDIEPNHNDTTFIVVAQVKTNGQTGVEMEALTAVSTACLTIYDMLKAVDPAMVISGIQLMEKRGGKSDFDLKQPTPPAKAT